jgi:predicted DNA-binding protein (UPF0251 family)
MQMLRLLATHGRDLFVFSVPEVEACLGRDGANELVLPVVGVSRKHALVRRVPGGVEILDLKSKNGICVGGVRVDRLLLTPGVRAQIGEAWLELEELSATESRLAASLQHGESKGSEGPTISVAPPPQPPVHGAASAESALGFFCHLEAVGVGLPGERPAVLAQARDHLGAESIFSTEKTRRGLFVRESSGLIPSDEAEKLLVTLSTAPWPFRGAEVRLQRAGLVILAGREDWFIGARFGSEALAREPWRRDVLRFLAARFFEPARTPRRFKVEELERVLALSGGNKSEAARLLGVKRQTVYNLLKTISRRKSV